uniref:Uncharacterized protein n=1 Tax=Octopus bimaculoides TaxID=37653 RepID=A0A0L8G2R5_OCTBM
MKTFLIIFFQKSYIYYNSQREKYNKVTKKCKNKLRKCEINGTKEDLRNPKCKNKTKSTSTVVDAFIKSCQASKSSNDYNKNHMSCNSNTAVDL